MSASVVVPRKSRVDGRGCSPGGTDTAEKSSDLTECELRASGARPNLLARRADLCRRPKPQLEDPQAKAPVQSRRLIVHLRQHKSVTPTPAPIEVAFAADDIGGASDSPASLAS